MYMYVYKQIGQKGGRGGGRENPCKYSGKMRGCEFYSCVILPSSVAGMDQGRAALGEPA